MGQHKYNPTAIAAKNGEIPPKPKPLSKRERETMAYIAFQDAVHKKRTNDAIRHAYSSGRR